LRVLVLFDIARSVPIDESFGPRILRQREDKPTEADVITGLRTLGHEVETLAVFDDVLAIIEKVKAFQPDIVFNLSESFHYDRAHEPNIPAMLNLMKVRYTGCGPEGLLLCKDKVLTKKILAYHDVSLPRFEVFPMGRTVKKPEGLDFPMPRGNDIDYYLVYIGFDPAGAEPEPRRPARAKPKTAKPKSARPAG